jgi:GT2 family glycosyltransferase
MPAELLASVVVVNYNGRHFLADCLGALERQSLPRHRFEVLLIDNGSADGSADFVRRTFPGARVHALPDNRGFAGGNNLGIQLARGRYIVLLNNDTRAEPHWLEALVAAAESGDHIGGVASRLLFRDEPHLVNSTGLLLYRDGRGGDRHLRRPDGPETQRPAEVFGGCGASLLLTRAMIADVGGFDERLFMYYEDLDLCWRARLRGWRFAYAPDSVVHHVCGGSTRPDSPFLLRQVERNRVLVNLRNAPPWLALWSALGLVLRFGRLVFRLLAARETHRLRAGHLRAMAAAAGGVIAALPVTVLDRYRVRVRQRRIPDRAVTRFMAPFPPADQRRAA